MKYYCSSLPPRILANYGVKNLNCKNSVKNHEHDFTILKYRKTHNITQHRLFYAYLNNIFNQVDVGNILNHISINQILEKNIKTY